MDAPLPARRRLSALRNLLHKEASGGLILMASAAMVLIIANSPLAGSYFATLKITSDP